MDENINDTIGDIIEQLQSNNKQVVEARVERDPLKKEELEDFVIKKGGELIQDALEMVQTIRNDVAAAPDDKNIEAFASLISATANAIDTLNRNLISVKKNETTVAVKKMDIDSRKELQAAESETKLALTREEIFKMLLNNAKPIEAEIVSNKRIE
jgi:sulfur carrier protein ThiS